MAKILIETILDFDNRPHYLIYKDDKSEHLSLDENDAFLLAKYLSNSLMLLGSKNLGKMEN